MSTSEKKEKSEMDEEPSMLVSIGVLAIFATCLPSESVNAIYGFSAITDFFKKNFVDFSYDIIRNNFSN